MVRVDVPGLPTGWQVLVEEKSASIYVVELWRGESQHARLVGWDPQMDDMLNQCKEIAEDIEQRQSEAIEAKETRRS